MKCKVFTGTWGEALHNFNDWAKGKLLTRDVIIHEQMYRNRDSLAELGVIIFVYFPEGSLWDNEPKKSNAEMTQEEKEKALTDYKKEFP